MHDAERGHHHAAQTHEGAHAGEQEHHPGDGGHPPDPEPEVGAETGALERHQAHRHEQRGVADDTDQHPRRGRGQRLDPGQAEHLAPGRPHQPQRGEPLVAAGDAEAAAAPPSDSSGTVTSTTPTIARNT